MIAAGGTGGHIVPGLAVARELQARGADVLFVGTERGLEKRMVPMAGFSLEMVSSGPLKSVPFLTLIKSLLAIPRGVFECLALIKQHKVKAVLGVGGYASGPMMLAARLRGVPAMVLEPNAAPGLANRRAGKWAKAAAINFPEAAKYFKNAEVTGIPVRPEFFALANRTRTAKGPVLLIFGGSQGARVLNHRIPEIAQRLVNAVPGLTIVHQAGAIHERSTQMLYTQNGIPSEVVKVRAFLDDMPEFFGEATLVLCRSGASTVAELAAAGKPAVLVPFPAATDDHQLKNALSFAGQGAAVVIEERYVSADMLYKTILELLQNPERLARLSEAARAQAHPDAAARIADMLEEIGG